MPTSPALELTEDTPFEVMRRTWQPVAMSADLPVGKVTSYRLFDVELVIARFASTDCSRRRTVARTRARA